jgi:VWFA-related protein
MKTQWFRHGHAFVLGLALIVGVFVIAGCGGGGGGGESSASLPSPKITLDEASIVFGSQVIGGDPAFRSLKVSNTGDADLVIGQIAQFDPLSFFSIDEDTCSDKTLRPGNSCAVLVGFVPEALGDFSGSFVIPSNDKNPTVEVYGNGRNWRVKINDVYDAEWPVIKMIVTVTDANNRAIDYLDATNFRVFEGGVPMAIGVMNAAQVRPVSVVLALDNSNSLTDDQNDVKAAAEDFLSSFSNAEDEAAVIKFASTVYRAIEFTFVVEDLLKPFPDLFAAIEADYPDDPSGTKFYDAVYDSVTLLAGGSATNRRAVIVVSDAVDEKTPSTQTLGSVIDYAGANGVSVYTIGLGNQLKADVMGQLADETGGLFFDLTGTDPPDVGSAYDDIAVAFREQYEITFTTGTAKDTEKTLIVQVVEAGALQGDDSVVVIY